MFPQFSQYFRKIKKGFPACSLMKFCILLLVALILFPLCWKGHLRATKALKHWMPLVESLLCLLLSLVQRKLSNQLNSDSHLPKKVCYLFHWKSFKSDEECFLFHLQRSFCSQDIWAFIMTFWSCNKSDLIRKRRLISKFMRSQTG